MPEREVHHSRYGRGVVKRTRHKGFELEVVFEDGVTRWVRLDELKETAMKFPEPPVPPHPPRAVSSDELKYRRMIEAFRLGIVPYDCVEEFTFGRDEETRRLMDWLDSSNYSTLLIIGGYGTGKTHLLHYGLGKALQQGFAVAWVELDPNEAPFHKPKRVYSRLIQNLKYRSQQDRQLRGFRDCVKQILSRGAFKDHIYFKHLIDKTHDETLWDWIEAREAVPRPSTHYNWTYSFLPSLYDYSNAANIYCYLLSALGWAVKEILGLKGLLLIFDEAETVNMYDYSYQAEKSLNFLKALIRTANDEIELLKTPSESGLDYCRKGIAKDVPFLYKSPSNLKLLFAFTSLDRNYDGSYKGVPKLTEVENSQRIELEPLTNDALKEVFENICLLYSYSYNFIEDDSIINAIFRKVNTQSGRTRLFVKGSVEAIDLVRIYRNKPLEEVLR